MGSRVLGTMLFIAILAIVFLNYKHLLTFSQEHMLYNNAQKAIVAGDWEHAIDVYRSGLREYPDNTDIALRLGWLYERNNQLPQAEKVYRNILDTQPANTGALIGLGNVLKQDPLRINAAVDVLRKAMQQDKNDPVLLSQIGNLYKTAAESPQETRQPIRKWLYDESRYYYQLSLKLDPRQFQTSFNLGVAYEALGNETDAARSYCAAIVEVPDSYEARFNLGLALSNLNFLDEAYRQMDQAVSLVSDTGDDTTARMLAQKVQNVKNAIYNNPEKQGLEGQAVPPFLNKACLVKPLNAGSN